MIRVGIYTGYMDKFGLTGPNVYLVNLIQHLSTHVDIDLYLIHHQQDLNPIYKDANEILIPRWPLLGELYLRRFNLDIIHFNYIPWDYRLFFPLLESRRVATSHINIGWSDWKPRHVEKWIKTFTANFLDTIIAVSKDLKGRLLKYLRIPESKIRVIYEGINHEIFKPLGDTDLARVKSKYALKKRYILHVSNFSMRKNPHTLFYTFHSLVKDGFEGKLLIAGSNWRNTISENLMHDLGIRNKVRIVGYIPIKDLVAFYNLAELTFFPSHHENFCFPIVETMACGAPVVASRVYSIPEITGDAAILYEPDDCKGFTTAIKTILEDESLREKMRKRGLKNARRFSWDKCAKETIEVYKKMLD